MNDSFIDLKISEKNMTYIMRYLTDQGKVLRTPLAHDLKLRMSVGIASLASCTEPIRQYEAFNPLRTHA